MQHAEAWKPTKYLPIGDTWRASRDPQQVTPASRLIADCLAQRYHQLIAQHATGALLDHGCGQAPLYGMYRARTSDVTAIDWEHSPHDISYVDHAVDLNGRLPFDDGRFDTIVSSDVIEHLWNPLLVFQELSRVLKPGGKLIVGTPFNYWMHERPHDYFRWTPHAIQKLGAETRLETLELYACGGVREVLVDTALKALPRRLRRFAPALDHIARATRFVSIDRVSQGPFTLGVVAVLQRRG